jgi:hypothetical protein
MNSVDHGFGDAMKPGEAIDEPLKIHYQYYWFSMGTYQ